MATVLIRNVDEDVVLRLKLRAQESGTSLEAIARRALGDAARQSRAEFAAWARANALRQPPQTSDSVEHLRRLRDGLPDDDAT